MFRWRQRNTASGGQNAGARPGRDSHQPEGLSQRLAGGEREESARAEGITRDVAPGVGKDPRGERSSRGERPQSSSKRGLYAVRIHCWSKALKAEIGLRTF